MAKHDEFDDFFGEDETAPVVDTRADGRLYKVPVSRLAANGVNPRTDFGTEDQLIDLGKSLARRQNQPCPAVSRTAYLKLWPDHSNLVKDVDYVLVSGERRFRAANAAGLPVLDCVVNDDFARDRRTFMEAVVSENVDRQNFDPVEEAYAVKALAAEFGSNRAVAQHFERADGWVTQRILLTHLAREAQELVRKKTIPLESARSLGKLTRDNEWDVAAQLAWWDSEQDRRAAAALARAAARVRDKQEPPSGTGAGSDSFTAVKPGTVRPEPNRSTDKPATEQPAQKPARAADRSGLVETALPEPRRDDSSAAPSDDAQSATGDGSAEATYTLPPGGWQGLLKVIVAELPEFERHMLTHQLKALMRSEVGDDSRSK